jgi:hypothetical protein
MCGECDVACRMRPTPESQREVPSRRPPSSLRRTVILLQLSHFYKNQDRKIIPCASCGSRSISIVVCHSFLDDWTGILTRFLIIHMRCCNTLPSDRQFALSFFCSSSDDRFFCLQRKYLAICRKLSKYRYLTLTPFKIFMRSALRFEWN